MPHLGFFCGKINHKKCKFPQIPKRLSWSEFSKLLSTFRRWSTTCLALQHPKAMNTSYNVYNTQEFSRYTMKLYSSVFISSTQNIWMQRMSSGSTQPQCECTLSGCQVTDTHSVTSMYTYNWQNYTLFVQRKNHTFCSKHNDSEIPGWHCEIPEVHKRERGGGADFPGHF